MYGRTSYDTKTMWENKTLVHILAFTWYFYNQGKHEDANVEVKDVNFCFVSYKWNTNRIKFFDIMYTDILC